MKRTSLIARVVILSFGIASLGVPNPIKAEPVTHGHFSSWEDVPEIIDSISPDKYREQLEQLHSLTGIKLGWPESFTTNKAHSSYVIQTKERWSDWWKATGKPINALKKQHAKVDHEALAVAWKFFDHKLEKPENILPVWIPRTWTLCITFTNGDYMGAEREIWIIHRQQKNVNMTKLRGDYSQGAWSVSLKKTRS